MFIKQESNSATQKYCTKSSQHNYRVSFIVVFHLFVVHLINQTYHSIDHNISIDIFQNECDSETNAPSTSARQNETEIDNIKNSKDCVDEVQGDM